MANYVCMYSFCESLHRLYLLRIYKNKQIFPEVIVSPNGSQFRANNFNAFLTSYETRHMYTAVYSPQNNASERANKSIIAGNRAYLKKNHKLWGDHLTKISSALRNSYHLAIKCTLCLHFDDTR